MYNEINIKIPERLSERTFSKVQEQFTYKSIMKSNSVCFELDSVTFISPFGMMLLIILIEHTYYNLSKDIYIKLPGLNISVESANCMAVLSRLRFFECLPKKTVYVNGKPESKKALVGKNPEILELTKLKSIETSLEVIDKAKKALRKTNYDDAHVSDIAIMISEVVQNIFIHSESERPAFLAIQSFPRLKKVQLAIADSGIGIPETLRSSGFYHNTLRDFELIFQSLRLGVSRFQKTEKRGEGLQRCRIIARKHSAEFFVRSNSGFYHLDYEKESKEGYEIPFLIGTQIFINFPMN